MENLVTIALGVAFLLLLFLLLCRLEWLVDTAERVARALELRAPSDDPAAADGGDAAIAVEWSMFAGPFVQSRLDALSRELDRLERDPDVFARAFHTIAAQSAYEALAADAARIAARPQAMAAGSLEFELMGPSSGAREEIEI